jgi:class 3 adenylate cyclase/tetratricopeptide (TPR) repeat protein
VSENEICSSCGARRQQNARFCPFCGADLGAPSRRAVRKTVTVLFCDIVGSTQLGERLDPEPFRHVMSRYYTTMQVVIRRHGGHIEKFIGDAVMAVFGVPQAHEDDALRAVRAAIETRGALDELNEELERTLGVTIQTRTGINTGEVIAGDTRQYESYVTGGPVNIAARLEQAAGPGETVIGAETERLVHAAVALEQLPALTLKGAEGPVAAWRVLDVRPEVPGWTRNMDAPLVGRERELAQLESIFDRTLASCSHEVITIMGPAGVGKSRLTTAFLQRVRSRATVLAGTCLPYGEGITFWPIGAILRDAADIAERDSAAAARRKVTELLPEEPDTPLVVDRLLALLGFAPTTPGVQETFWAVRKLCEWLSRQRPLVVVFDDIHWGEPTFLDLLEYLADWAGSSPVLIVCQARVELLDVRPGWLGDKPNAATISIPLLTSTEIDEQMRNLLGGSELERRARNRIVELAEGNPLYVEETLRMLTDNGELRRREDRWILDRDLSSFPIPPTIDALLTARVDRLGVHERAIVERASVIGRSFLGRAVSELLTDNGRELTKHLQSLMRKELIRHEPAEQRFEDAFQFSHILIRDTVYNAIPKATRAEMHEQTAELMESQAWAAMGEYEEILGYHLERSYRLLLDIGMRTEEIAAIGRRASVPLASAGKRAFARGDMPAAVNLLSRAAGLLPAKDSHRLELLPDLAFALMETGDFPGLQAIVAETSAAASEMRDAGLQAHAGILSLWIRLFTNPEGWAAEAQRESTRAITSFEAIGNQRGLAKGWSLLGLVNIMKAQFAAAEEAFENAADHARRAGDRRDELESLSWLPLVVWAGPTPAQVGISRCQAILQRAAGDKKSMSSALLSQAVFEAGLERFDESRELLGRARALLEEVALTVWLAGPLTQFAGWAELLAGNPVEAERLLRWGQETLGRVGEVSWLSTVVGIRAEAAYVQGHYDEAEELTHASEQTAGAEDVYSHVLWRSVRAKVLARRGQSGDAAALLHECGVLCETIDFSHLRWHALLSRAEVLQILGRRAEAAQTAAEAAVVADQKGNLAGARLARTTATRIATSP